MSFGGPRMLGHSIRVTRDTRDQDKEISEAEEIIAGGCVGHNQPFFYRDAIEVMVQRQDWAQVHRHADSLEAFSAQEGLPWSDFYVARARALASCYSDQRSAESSAVLHALRNDAVGFGLHSSLPAIDRAMNAD